MICKDWNKKKLTALVCAGLMAGTLLPCGIVSADSVTITDPITDPSGSLPLGVKSIAFDPMGYGMGSITLKNSGDILVLDFSGTSYTSFLGGFAEETAISNSQVSLCNGNVDGYVYGGYSNKSVTFNKVAISGGEVYEVDGGYSTNEAVTDNTVEISGDAIVVGSVYGGVGGGNATNNAVTISDNATIQTIVGGGSSSENNATNNVVTISGGTVEGAYVCGGSSYYGAATDNTVKISGDGTVKRVYGGSSEEGTATKNAVEISGNGTAQDVYGGYSGSGSVTENTVTISGNGTAQEVYGGYSGSGSVTENTVTMSGGMVEYVYGGCSYGSCSVTGNTVTISGGKVDAVYGGCSDEGAATENIVTISGGTVGYVSGGCSDGSGAATGNTVNLIGLGGTLEGAVTNNPNKPSITGTVYGGRSYYSTKVSGNTLNVYGTGTQVGNIVNFETINFYVPASAVNEDVMLKCTDTAKATSLKGTTVNTGVESTSQLKKGEKIVLLKNENTITTDDATKLGGKIEVGGWMEYDGTVALENGDKELVLTLNKDMQPEEPPTPDPDPTPTPTPTPEPPKPDRLTESSKTFAETRAAEVSFLNNGSDLITKQGILNAQMAAEAEEQAAAAEDKNSDVVRAQVGFAPFAALGAASMRYETGSYVDSKGWGINVGASRILHQEDGKTLLAPFLEYGKASYDSYLDNGTHGNGANQYFGVGFLARKDLNTGLYYEGSIRLGQMKGDYEGLDKYDTKSMYYALHAGIGKVVPVNDKSSMDYYGKLFYTHQNGDSVDLQKQYGEMDFDAINSFRTRLGFRYNHNVSEDSTFYTGLAWDYEFGSEARASYRGLSTPTPSMKGSSGLLELGWKRPISEKNPVAIDVNLTGYAGKQRGISANVGLNWAF